MIESAQKMPDKTTSTVVEVIKPTEEAPFNTQAFWLLVWMAKYESAASFSDSFWIKLTFSFSATFSWHCWTKLHLLRLISSIHMLYQPYIWRVTFLELKFIFCFRGQLNNNNDDHFVPEFNNWSLPQFTGMLNQSNWRAQVDGLSSCSPWSFRLILPSETRLFAGFPWTSIKYTSNSILITPFTLSHTDNHVSLLLHHRSVAPSFLWSWW